MTRWPARRGPRRVRAEIPADLMMPDGTRCGEWKAWVADPGNGWHFVDFLKESMRRRREWHRGSHQ